MDDAAHQATGLHTLEDLKVDQVTKKATYYTGHTIHGETLIVKIKAW